jgi:HSP20 family protein
MTMARELTVWKPSSELRPFRDFEGIKKEMEHFWDSFFDVESRTRGEEGRSWFPSLDVSETKDEIVVKAEVPGMDPKDLEISLSDGVLHIRGEKKQEREEKEEDYHLRERNYGFFARSLRLPMEVNHDKINASYKNGVLKIVLPKSEEARKKEIKINVV